MKKRIFAFTLVLMLVITTSVAYTQPRPDEDTGSWAGGCTNILVGKAATVDGSVIGTYSCDGAIYAKTELIPAKSYEPGSMLAIHSKPYPNNWNQYLSYLDDEVLLAEIPQVERTYRYISNTVYYDDQSCGGINEYGVAIGETTISGNRNLSSTNGWMWAYSNYPETSLMALGLQRAKTAREAVEIMGALAEKYGYTQTGEHMTISDENEVWAMEIFGAGRGWTQGSGKPGAVWAAVRVPDGQIAFSANSSRIGVVDEATVADTGNFLCSSNLFALAQEMNLWSPGSEFVWYRVYGNRTAGLSEREWSIVNKFAPSLGAQVGDPVTDFFSFTPDAKVATQDIMAMYRDYFNGIEGMDITMNAKYKLSNGNTSPVAGPFGPSALQQLLGLSAKRSVATRTSVFTYVAQHKSWLPDAVGSVMWYTPGTALTGSYTPIYAGTTKLPESWTDTTKDSLDRNDAWWAFQMVEGLSEIEFQNAIKDIQAVRDPAEAKFLAEQAEVEAAVTALQYNPAGKLHNADKIKRDTEAYVTDYTNAALTAVEDTYWDLVDYLMFKYYFRSGKNIPAALPAVPAA